VPERRGCDEPDWLGVGWGLPVGHADGLNPNGAYGQGERWKPWSQPLGFDPEDGRVPYAVARLVVVRGYRPRAPR